MDKGIVYTQWDVPSAQAYFLCVHGLGGHSGRWEFLSCFLRSHGISTYAIELKGFGATADLKGHIDSFRIYFDDIRALHTIIRKEHQGAKIFLLGESLGGLLCFLLAIEEPELFQGLICISPAFKPKLKFSPYEHIQIFLSACFNPQKQFTMPFNAQMCTRDIHYQMVMNQDAMEHRLASAKLLINTIKAQMRAGSLQHRLAIPTLFLLSGSDLLVDSHRSAQIFEKLKVKDKTIMQYPDMYHVLEVDLGREKVFADMLKWLQARLP